jgi:Ribbon-helix-helix protein, copG family
MKRTTVKISEELDTLLRHEADRRGLTISEVIREALESYFSLNGTPRRRFLAAGAGSSGYTDTAARIEEILAEEWAEPRRS